MVEREYSSDSVISQMSEEGKTFDALSFVIAGVASSRNDKWQT